VVGRILDELDRRLAEDGFASLSAAIGSDPRG
jgi:hypothetical protein